MAPMLRPLLTSLALVPALLLVAPTAQAKCAAYADWLLTEAVAGPSPIIVVAVYSVDDAEQFGPFALTGPRGEAIRLNVRARHEGMQSSQIELEPAQPLQPGKYQVARTSTPKYGRIQPHELTVVDGNRAEQRSAPDVTSRGSSRQEFGCGPAENIELTLKRTGGARLAFVTLTDVGTREVHTGYVKIGEGGELSIGHGMCSGEFMPRDGARYRVEVRLVAAGGMLSDAASLEVSYRPRAE